jgi:hypothetical protein
MPRRRPLAAVALVAAALIAIAALSWIDPWWPYDLSHHPELHR